MSKGALPSKESRCKVHRPMTSSSAPASAAGQEMTDRPPALLSFLEREFADERLRVRALHAPWPETGFRSAWEEHTAWESPGERSKCFEDAILEHREWVTDQSLPYFALPGTGGTLRSPYPDLSDGEWWLYVCFWGGEFEAQQAIEKWPVVELGFRPTLAYLRWARRRKLGRFIDRIMGKPLRDPRAVAWKAQYTLAFHPYL